MKVRLILLVVHLLLITIAHSQLRPIQGQIMDETGAPVPFASIQVKGNRTGTSADAKGNFKIIARTNDVLHISAVNYLATEIVVPSSGTISISLSLTSQSESEVIVTAQGISHRSREIGYSVSQVNTAELTNGRSQQMAVGLSGKVSGLVITNANSSVLPSVKFTLRGFRSMTGNNNVLIVIDGFPNASPSMLNPEDIESITVLKGGQAATLYGSNGINGAILVTTKKGQKGKLKIKYSSSFNIEKINNLAQFQDSYGGGSHYADGFGTPGYKTNYLDRMKDNWRSYENQQYGDAYDGSIRPVGRTLEDGSILMLPYAAIKGVREDIWNTGYTLNNQVSFSGGNDNTSFYFSGEHNRTEGIVPKDIATRTGVRVAASHQSTKFKIGFIANFMQAKYALTNSDFYSQTLNQPAHIPLADFKDWQTNKYANPNGYYNDYVSNPFFLLDQNRSKILDSYLNGTTQLSYKLYSWLSLSNQFGIANRTNSSKSTFGQFFHSNWAKTKAIVPAPWDRNDGAGIYRALTDYQGAVSDNIITSTIINNDFHLLINKKYKSISIKSMIGHNIYSLQSKSVFVSSSAIVVPNIYNVSNRRGELGGGENSSDERRYGFYADAMIGWKEMVFLHGSYRMDATSRFYKRTRARNQYTYKYPGVDLSAIITELIPTIRNKVLSYAKLRISYNKNGNDNIGLYGLDPVFSNAPGFPYGNNVGITVGGTIPDEGLKPEFVNSFETGTEIQLFNNKINIDFSYYYQKSKGQVLRTTILSSTGFTNLLLNAGDAKNWGYEVDLKARLLNTVKLKWDLVLRGSINENKVIKLYKDISELFVSGYSSYAGIFVMQDMVFPVLKGIAYERDSLGRVIIDKDTGYPLTSGPFKNFGRVTPKYMVGAGTTVSFAGFTLSTNWEYRGGNVMYSDVGAAMTFTGSGKWTQDRAPHIFPNSSYFDGSKYVANTTIKTREAEYELWVDAWGYIAENYTVPAWFIKMRDINLSYSFPGKLISKLRIFSDVNIALYGRNLVTIIDKANQFTDPEFSNSTGNGIGMNGTGQNQPVKQYGINLNLSFK